MGTKRISKIAVAMSGGVDSSMAAVLLKEKGYEVIGVTMLTHKEAKAAQEARKVAEQLGIPHYIFDLSPAFEQEVITYFTESYLRGETPNPCVVCNWRIKFGEFLSQARNLGTNYIATGHYVQKLYDHTAGRWLLYTAKDQRKDQSYMLYSLKQEQLAAAIFPLGDYTKDEVREMARERNLFEVSEKKESQEVCFITEDYPTFILNRTAVKAEPGNFVDLQGNILGEHKGLIYYTVGQRKGLGKAFGKPMYVVALNPEKNEVILGDNEDVFTNVLWVSDLNWIPFETIKEPLRVEAKIRYKALPAPAMVYQEKNSKIVRVEFDSPQRAVTPGQSIVFYNGPLVLGGGRIVSDKLGIRKDILNSPKTSE